MRVGVGRGRPRGGQCAACSHAPPREHTALRTSVCCMGRVYRRCCGQMQGAQGQHKGQGAKHTRCAIMQGREGGTVHAILLRRAGLYAMAKKIPAGQKQGAGDRTRGARVDKKARPPATGGQTACKNAWADGKMKKRRGQLQTPRKALGRARYT